MIPKTTNPKVKMLLEFYEDRLKGAITQEQLETACHYWAYENAFDEMTFKPYPSEPHDLMEWNRMSSRQKEAVPEDVRNRMERLVAGFYDMHNGIRNINKTNLTYLLEMEKTFLRYDQTKAAEVRTRINDFQSKSVKPW